MTDYISKLVVSFDICIFVVLQTCILENIFAA